MKGFSLLEVILSTFVLSAAILGGLLVMETASLHAANGDVHTLAVYAANEKLESILADRAAFGYDYLDADGRYPDESSAGSLSSFRRKVKITEVSRDDLSQPETGSGLKRIDVEVTWGATHDRVVVMSTLVAK